MKKLFSICLFNTHKTAQRGWFRWGCLQYPGTNCFTGSDWRHQSLFGS